MLDVQQSLAAQSRMENDRRRFERAWQDAAELCLPRQADFDNRYRIQGEDRSNVIFDEYAQQAADDGVSVFEGMVMPRGQLWQLMTPPDDELAKLQHVAAWYEAKSRRLHKLRAAARSGFVQESNESAASLLVFGNQAMEVEHLIDPVLGRPVGLRYRSEHLGRVYWDEDWQGLPSRRHVKFTMTAANALSRFGQRLLDRAPNVARAATGTDADKAKSFEFIRVIAPNERLDPRRMDARGKPWLHGILSVADKSFVEDGGYRSCPITISRFRKSPTEAYGRGPGTEVLPSIKAAQAIMLDLMVGAELGLRPAVGAPDDATDMLINYAAGDVTYGAIDHQGRKLIQTLFEVGDMQGALAVQEMVHKIIDRAFFRHLLALSQDLKSHVTDGQLYERTQEKGILLSPMARQESEWFTPMLEREQDLMAQMGEFDDMPMEVREAGGLRLVEYDNPLNRALKADGVGAYFGVLSDIAGVAQYRPQAFDEFFAEYPFQQALREIGVARGIPPSLRATDAQREQAAKDKAQQQAMAQVQQLAQTIEPVARTANELGGALGNG